MPISKKQKQVMAFPFTDYDALIADGSIRSGKTAFMTIAFVDDAMRRFNHQLFGISGNTVDSAIKNIITPYLGVKLEREKYSITWKRTEKLLIVKRGTVVNQFEVFGGKDESSFKLIQGRTLAGMLMDEVALQPRSFVEQAIARCSVDGSKLWFNCNPDSPQHWFYKEWICNLKLHNAIRLHFQLEDNPSLSKKIVDRYKSMYTGVFYRRYILGEWCIAEGLVYDFGEENITDEIPENGEYYISIDYGTQNPFSAGLWCVRGDKAIRIKEYYWNGRERGVQKTDEEYCDEVVKLADSINEYDSDGYLIKKREVLKTVVDPSAASFITALKKRDMKVVKAKNDVLDGIRLTAVMLKNGNIKIHRSCGDSISEFGLYSWDSKSTEDKVIKTNDHAMDDIRYFCNTIMKKKLKKDEAIPLDLL